MNRRILACALAALLVPLTDPAEAFSYRMMSDNALLDSSQVVVTATVLGVDKERSGPNQTVYLLSIRDRLGRGSVGKAALLKLPGGLPNENFFWMVPGIPRLAVGENVLVAGIWDKDGSLVPNQLSLGLFQERVVSGERIYTRFLQDANELGDGAQWHYVRDAALFEQWISDNRVGKRRTVNYLREDIAPPVDAKFTLIEFTIGANTRAGRWSKFDSNQTENWTARSDGQTNMGAVSSFTIFQNALSAWTNDAGSKILLGYGGTNAAIDTHCDDGTSDGSRILWNDPLNTIAGSYNCASGGVLATGGPCVSSATSTVDGTVYFNAFEGRVEVQNNAGCFLSEDNGLSGAEVLTHELGHSLGFGHSCGDAESPACVGGSVLDNATMRAFAHGDGRGGAIDIDDQAAAATVYPETSTGTISIADRTLGEATSPMNFTLTRTVTTGTASVVATTAPGSATGGGTDYTNVTSQTVNFADGSATATLNVTINNDAIDEDNETFVVNLTTPSAGYTISDTQATGTITDNDTTSISVNDPAAVTEGNPINFTVTLSHANSRVVTVSRATANGTAAASGDFTALSASTLTFNPGGPLTQQVQVTTNNDLLNEADSEQFTLNLSNVSATAVIGDASGTGTINDNDATPTLSIADAAPEAENNINPIRFVVSLSGPNQDPISVTATTADGSATVANNDYQARSSVVNFASGITSQNFDVTKFGDTTFESNETMSVALTGASGGISVTDANATGTITNDDGGPAVSIADAARVEGNVGTANLTFTVSIANPVGANVVVNFNTSPIDATATLDYTATSGSATIVAPATSATLNVPIVGDVIDEWDEQFTVNLTATSTSTIGDGQAVGTITDDDVGLLLHRSSFE